MCEQLLTHTHTHTVNGPYSGITQVSRYTQTRLTALCLGQSRYQKGKTNFTEARDSEWQWHQLGCMQVYTSLHTSTPPLKVFYRPDALPAARSSSVKALKETEFTCCVVDEWW